MKVMTIALKDLSRAFRSMFALAFMFGVPILMTLLFAFLFGGVGGSSDFSVPKTDVVLVNQDTGSELVPSFNLNDQSFTTMGDMLVNILQDNAFTDLMSITLGTETDARTAVDTRQAGLAIIIPPGFTDTLIGLGEKQVSIEFYKDPELSLGPQVTESIVMSVVDGFSSGTLSMDTIIRILSEHGVTLSQNDQIALVQSLTANAESSGQTGNSGLIIISPTEPCCRPSSAVLWAA